MTQWLSTAQNTKSINPEYSLEWLILKLKLQCFGHLTQRADSLEKSFLLGKTEGRRDDQRMRWLDGIINAMGINLGKLREMVRNREAWRTLAHEITKSWTRLSNWTHTYSTPKGLSKWSYWYRTHLPSQETLEMQVQFLDQEDPLEKDMATYSSILAWRIPWTEEPGGLQSIGLQRVRQNWFDLAYRHIPWKPRSLTMTSHLPKSVKTNSLLLDNFTQT